MTDPEDTVDPAEAAAIPGQALDQIRTGELTASPELVHRPEGAMQALDRLGRVTDKSTAMRRG